MTFVTFLFLGFAVVTSYRVIRQQFVHARFAKLNKEWMEINNELTEYRVNGQLLNAKAALARLKENLEKQKRCVGFKETKHEA